MAILGSIRKRPLFLILVIGLAIFAFILADGINSNNGPTRTDVGSINGNDIDGREFSERVDAYKSNNPNNITNIQQVNNAWNAVIREKIYEDQLERAGIEVGEKDIWDAIINSPAYQNNPQYQNEEGLFDEEKVREFIATLKSEKRTRQQWIDNETSIKNSLRNSTYDNLVKAGLTASVKDGELFYNSENTMADIQVVYQSYTSVNDSLAEVTDEEVIAYIKDHADDFEADATRDIEYVNFEVKPSEQDIELVKEELVKIIDDHQDYNKRTKTNEQIIGLKNTTDHAGFVTEYSDAAYVDKVYFTNDLATGVYDSILQLPKGSVYGPFIDGDYYKIIKYIDSKDEKSVKSSHILVAYEGSAARNPDVKRTKEEAEAEANRLLKKVTVSNFGKMAEENSDDLGSKANQGKLGNWYKEDGSLVKEYSDFIFNNPEGKIGLVESMFGYHIIKVDEVKTESGLDLAIVSRKIDPSSETESNVYQEAETFAADINDGKDILTLAKDKGYAIKKANNLKELGEDVTGLGKQREIVRWTFEDGVEIGDIKRFDLEGSYAVVIVKNKNKKGLTALSIAKPRVLPQLRKEKKIAILKEKMQGATIDDIARSLGRSVNTAKDVSLANPNTTVGGNDESVAGALLYMDEGDMKIVEGKNGVYAVKVIKKTPISIKNYNTYSRNITSQLKAKTGQIYNAFKDAADIDDQRATVY